MNTKLLTVNCHFKLQENSHLLNKLRRFIKKIKRLNPTLRDYELYDVGFIPRFGFILVKLYFYKK